MKTTIAPHSPSSWGMNNGSWLLIAVLVHGLLFCVPVSPKTARDLASETIQWVLADPPPSPPEVILETPSAPVQRIETPPPKPVPIVRKPAPRPIQPVQQPRPESRPVVQEAPRSEAVAANDEQRADCPADPISGSGENKGTTTAASSPSYVSEGPSSGAVESRVGAVGGPQFIQRALPQYPRLARRLGVEGTVLLRLSIDASGKLTQAEVVQSAGHGFDEEALRAVRQSVFSPAVREGRPVACVALLHIRFQLNN